MVFIALTAMSFGIDPIIIRSLMDDGDLLSQIATQADPNYKPSPEQQNWLHLLA